MTAGSVLATAAVAGIALAPAYGWFVAAWLLAGAGMAGVFYPPAFAALTGWYGPDRVRALTTLTLAAGFASTIFAPLTATLGSWPPSPAATRSGPRRSRPAWTPPRLLCRRWRAR